ncbi:flagellar biosynthesis protein FlgA [Burkholderia territorii]|uniref:flagellar basal body P-ring formation chaperone FlgA n=1 Tax=Burkholderia territorii TaxID=1503055 RepID=UPI0007579700|nr:flagellar basal body P-ring formation chaperone FlgA [Burkholderia territorii]KWH08476.1 flagellar biosynthesis protein FlgA [Burkholderia territorii]
MRFIRTTPAALFLGLVTSATLAAPPASAPLSDLQVQARDATLARLKSLGEQAGLRDATFDVTVAPPKPPVPSCATPFSFTFGNFKQLARVGVIARCADSGLTVKLVARATVKATLPVAARDIDARREITRDDLDEEQRNLASLTDTVTRPDDAIGKASRRALRTGQVLSRRALLSPELVRRGQTVRIVARVGQAEIVNTGIALQTGGKNEVIRVRVGGTASGKVVSARITGPGSAEPADLPTPASH